MRIIVLAIQNTMICGVFPWLNWEICLQLHVANNHIACCKSDSNWIMTPQIFFTLVQLFLRMNLIMSFVCMLLVLSFQSTLPDEKIIVFVVSTTGQGDPPDSLKVCCFLAWIAIYAKSQVFSLNFSLQFVGVLEETFAKKSGKRLAGRSKLCFVWIGWFGLPEI